METGTSPPVDPGKDKKVSLVIMANGKAVRKFKRQGEENHEMYQKRVQETKDLFFPSSVFTIEEIEPRSIAAGSGGFFLLVKFPDKKDKVKIPHKFKKESKAQSDAKAMYGHTPEVTWEVVSADEL